MEIQLKYTRKDRRLLQEKDTRESAARDSTCCCTCVFSIQSYWFDW